MNVDNGKDYYDVPGTSLSWTIFNMYNPRIVQLNFVETPGVLHICQDSGHKQASSGMISSIN